MALNEKYTWKDFLKENPDQKGLKRTSAEGKKAFEAASKKFLKEYLKNRLAKITRQQATATAIRDALVVRLKATKKAPLAKKMQLRVGQKDRAIAMFAKQIERTKEVQKQY